jgi:hypothetical protein
MATNIRHSIARTDETSFDGHEGANPEASIGDLLEGMFHNGSALSNATFLENVNECIHDELTLIAEVSERGGYSTTIARVAMRCEWWLKLAPEIQRRMIEAEKEVEQYEENDWEFYRVPMADDVPIFEHARPAIHKDFACLGYCRRENVLDAIGVLLRGKDETARGPVGADISEVLKS